MDALAANDIEELSYSRLRTSRSALQSGRLLTRINTPMTRLGKSNTFASTQQLPTSATSNDSHKIDLWRIDGPVEPPMLDDAVHIEFKF